MRLNHLFEVLTNELQLFIDRQRPRLGNPAHKTINAKFITCIQPPLCQAVCVQVKLAGCKRNTDRRVGCAGNNT